MRLQRRLPESEQEAGRSVQYLAFLREWQVNNQKHCCIWNTRQHHGELPPSMMEILIHSRHFHFILITTDYD